MSRKPYNSSKTKARNRLRYWRMARELTLEQLGELVDMPAQTVQRYETEDRLKVSQLRLFADALDVKPADLVESGDDLTAEERDLLNRYRGWDQATRETVKAVADAHDKFRDKKAG